MCQEHEWTSFNSYVISRSLSSFTDVLYKTKTAVGEEEKQLARTSLLHYVKAIYKNHTQYNFGLREYLLFHDSYVDIIAWKN